MDDLTDAAQDVNWSAIVSSVMSALASNENLSFDGVRGAVVAGVTQAHGAKMKAGLTWLTWIASKLGEALVDVEDDALPVLAGFVAPMVAGMFGTSVDAGAFSSRANSEQRTAAASALVAAFLDKVAGGTDGPQGASPDGATRLAVAGMQAALEGWFLAAVPELLSDLIPFEVGHFTAFTELPREVIDSLGIGRLTRRALMPLVNATAVQPMTRFANAKYRPTKPSATVLIRQFFRGNIDDATLTAELAELGYPDDYMDALVNEAKKFQPTADLLWMVWQGQISPDDATQTLQDEGYDPQTASKHVGVDTLKRTDAIHRELATAAIAAYVERRIEDGDLDGVLSATIASDTERGLLKDAATGKRALRALNLTPTEAKLCVENGIIPLSEYTDALTRAGYVPDAILALEMLLRKQMDDKATAASVKQAAQQARAAAATAKAQAAALKMEEVAAGRALKRRGSLATLEAAVVQGLIPIARLEEVLNADFDPDTVAIYVAEVEAKRQTYLAKQGAATGAAKTAAAKGLSVGQLQTALNDGVLTIDDVTQQLTAHGLTDAAVAVLRETMQQTADTHQKAAALHAAAAVKAAHKTVTLAEADALTRAGHWTLNDYNAFLATLGYDDADIANLDALVSDQIAKDAAARALHKTAATTPGAKGLTLAQWRSAVVLGLKSMADFAAWLTTEGYSADAVSTLAAEVEAAAQAAAAAQARRNKASSPSDGRAAALADVTRAARLGLMTPADYQSELQARGYSPAAVALELELLTHELAAAGGTGSAPGAATVAKATLKHTQVDGELAAKGLSLATVEKAVTDNLTTLDQYQAWLEANGYGTSDAELLRALLTIKLQASAPAPPPPPPAGP